VAILYLFNVEDDVILQSDNK